MRKLFLALCVCALAIGLSGCGKKDTPEQPPPPPASTGTSKIETMPEGSDEAVRIHRFDATGTKFEVEIKYRDGSSGIETLNTLSGAVKEYKRFSGKVVLNYTKFSNDGKKILERETRFKSGKLQDRLESLKNGERSFTRYVETGEVTEKCVLRADGSGEYVRMIRRPNGYLPYVSQQWKADGEMTIEVMNPNTGKVAKHYKAKGTELTGEGFRPDGTLSFRQHWQKRSDEEVKRLPYHGPYKLLKVELIGTDGKLERTLHYENSDASFGPVRAVIPQADGTTKEVISEGQDNVKVFVTDAAGKREEVPTVETDKELIRPSDWQAVQQPTGFNPNLVKNFLNMFQVAK